MVNSEYCGHCGGGKTSVELSYEHNFNTHAHIVLTIVTHTIHTRGRFFLVAYED